ncbi:MAG: glycerophosphodiester phosphodiesterase family protein [Bacteroidaceae bacterium]|nr:glycerophosphodiester phosphodiesterase family protein [Bacteroidaceae bacterium]
MMKKIYVLILLYCFCSSVLFAQHRAQLLREDFLNPRLKKVLVVSHRGNWRSAPENSLAAIDSAIVMKIDAVEIDVRKTKDGHLVLMHDNTVDRTTNGKGKVANLTLAQIKSLRLKDKDGNLTEHTVPTLEEAMLVAKNKIMVNLDKAYSIFPEVYDVLERTETANIVIMKGGAPVEKLRKEFSQYLDKVIYMPIVTIDKSGAEAFVKDYMKEMRPAAFELCYSDPASRMPKKMKKMLFKKTLLWYNSLWPSLNGGHDDEAALKDADGNYGYLIDKLGARIIQTDNPAYLLQYLRGRGLHD